LVYTLSNISTARPARYCPSGVISFLMDLDGERLKEGRQAATSAPSHQKGTAPTVGPRAWAWTCLFRTRG